MRICVQNGNATGKVADCMRGFLNHEGDEENVATEGTENSENLIVS
jgi:hypothetical protein